MCETSGRCVMSCMNACAYVCLRVTRSLSGYVQQQDVHIGTSTVREALELSAALRLPVSVTAAQRAAMVTEVGRRCVLHTLSVALSSLVSMQWVCVSVTAKLLSPLS